MSNGERAKGSIAANKNGWSELEGLSRDGCVDGGIDTVRKKVPLEERRKKVLWAKAKVEKSYRKGDVGDSSSMVVEADEEESSSRRHSPSIIERRLSEYDTIERFRVDRIKRRLNHSNISEYEGRQIVSRPNASVKIARLIADKLRIRTKRSEERREGEALHVALNEYYKEEAARRKAIEEKENEKARREREDFERDMAGAGRVLNKRNRFKKQRIQEMVERDLNSRLLKADDLEMEAISDNSEIQKRTVPFEDVDIPVYDLKGFPFSLLSTTIDYRRYNKPGEIGTETFKRVLEDPSIWAKRRDEAERESGFGTRDADAMGDTISASYWNSERNINSHVNGDLIYGFENVRADSIISISNGDGGTSNMAGGAETALSSLDNIKQLESVSGTDCYNEVLLRRYTENGVPKTPDYIIVEDGRITEKSLRHANYFGIPIVNIERSVYAKKAENKINELLASINEEDTYEDMDKKITELLGIQKFKTAYRTLKGIGRCYDTPRQMESTTLWGRCLDISRMEQLKRIEYIENVLEKAIRDIESATEKSLLIEKNLPGFDFFDIRIMDVQNQLERTEFCDKLVTSFSVPGNCNWIYVRFKLKGSPRNIETEIYDGERVFKVDEALARGNLTKEDLEKSDSSFYNALEPVTLRYFEAIRKNRELKEIEELA